MTRDRDFKHIVRARMRRTGESYTTSRAQLMRKKEPAPGPPPVPEPRLDVSAAGMSDAAVAAKTGRAWAEWVAILDAAGARTMSHRDIARHLHDRLGVGGWWAQMVTVGYERIRGLRAKGQRRDGAWEVNKSRTYPVAVGVLYRAFADARVRDRWLGAVPFTVRTSTANKSLRVDWPDGSRVQFFFVPKNGGKSAVAVQHARLASPQDADRVRRDWTERLAALSVLARPARVRKAAGAPRAR